MNKALKGSCIIPVLKNRYKKELIFTKKGKRLLKFVDTPDELEFVTAKYQKIRKRLISSEVVGFAKIDRSKKFISKYYKNR